MRKHIWVILFGVVLLTVTSACDGTPQSDEGDTVPDTDDRFIVDTVVVDPFELYEYDLGSWDGAYTVEIVRGAEVDGAYADDIMSELFQADDGTGKLVYRFRCDVNIDTSERVTLEIREKDNPDVLVQQVNIYILVSHVDPPDPLTTAPNVPLTYQESTIGAGQDLSTHWNTDDMKGLRCSFWYLDATANTLEWYVTNQMVTVPIPPLTYEARVVDRPSQMNIVIFKDDGECSESTGLPHDFLVEMNLEELSLNAPEQVTVETRHCLKGVGTPIGTSRLMDSPIGALCVYSDHAFTLSATPYCGGRDWFCANGVHSECPAAANVCDNGLDCVNERCAKLCTTDADCDNAYVYSCKYGACIPRGEL